MVRVLFRNLRGNLRGDLGGNLRGRCVVGTYGISLQYGYSMAFAVRKGKSSYAYK